MIGDLANHLWQSTLFAVAAGLLAVAFRGSRAEVRYWLWLSASVKFILPFSPLISLGGRSEWAAAAREFATPAVASAMVKISEPFPRVLPLAAAGWVTLAVLTVWACGFLAVALGCLRSWRRIRAVVRASQPMAVPAAGEARSAPGVLEPGVVGLGIGKWSPPVLVLPAGIERHLTPPQLEAVLAHEMCHVLRRDNLSSAFHMVVEAVFWFLPRVWWIGARLVEERERACDEAVLSLGIAPRDYAEAILNVCKHYVESPLVCVSGVTGADLKKRIQAILMGAVPGPLSFSQRAVLSGAMLAALALPLMVGMMNAPSVQAQSPAAAAAKFEVASIRPCGGADFGGKQKGGGPGPGPSPGRLTLRCVALVESDNLGLIQAAYIRFANGRMNWPIFIVPIEGGPSWIRSERFDIVAKAEGNATQETMRGPMMQRLLEDRFKLKVRRESREAPVYALTVAKGGPKLKPFREGSCASPDFSAGPPKLAPGQYLCGAMAGGRKGPNVTVDGHPASLDEFAKLLSLVLDRPVIDKTGIQGTFDLHLVFGPDQATPRFLPGGDLADFPAAASDDPPAPSIFTAMQQQFGLKIESAKGLREFLVIDRVEQPSAN